MSNTLLGKMEINKVGLIVNVDHATAQKRIKTMRTMYWNILGKAQVHDMIICDPDDSDKLTVSISELKMINIITSAGTSIPGQQELEMIYMYIVPIRTCMNCPNIIASIT